jgi:hypothetical protein
MGCEDNNIYRKELHEQDLTGLDELCANVARNRSTDCKQSDTAHALRMEWVRLRLDTSLDGARTDAEASLKKRMEEFLTGAPSWMLRGL